MKKTIRALALLLVMLMTLSLVLSGCTHARAASSGAVSGKIPDVKPIEALAGDASDNEDNNNEDGGGFRGAAGPC